MYTDIDGLGKFKLPGGKKLKKLLMTHPLAPPPVIAMGMKRKKKKAAPVETVAPIVPEPITLSPVERPEYYPQPLPVERPEYYPQPLPQPPQYFQPLPYFQPKPPQQIEQPSAAILPRDYFPTELEYDYREPELGVDRIPIITPYESAAMSQFGTDEEFMDTSAAYESEAGYLQGLGQETGSTGGWFSDLISVGAKELINIQKAKAAAKAARVPAPFFGTGVYRPSTVFGGFNMNTVIIIAGLGLAGLLIFRRTSKSKR